MLLRDIYRLKPDLETLEIKPDLNGIAIKEPLDPMPLILRQFRQLKKPAIPYRPGHDNLQSILPPSVQHLCLCLIANDADDVAAGLAFHQVRIGNLRSLEVYSKKGTPRVSSQDTWDALTAQGVEVSGDWQKGK